MAEENPVGATPVVDTPAPTVVDTPAPAVVAPATPAVEATPATPAVATPATPADDGSNEEPAVAPDEWAALRTKIAKGDEKLEKRLARYSSVESMAEALIAAQNKIASGGLKEPLPKDATPEQLAAWREDNGIPEAPEGYDVTLPDGLVIGEQDQPLVDDYLKIAHSQNQTPEQVKANLAWFFETQERQIEEQNNADLEAKETGEATLKEVWGGEAKLNKNLIRGLIDSAPAGVAEELLGARLASGIPLGSHPDTLRWLSDLARQVNPVATVVPGAGANASQAIETEIGKIEGLMRDKQSTYWKGSGAQAMQERYRQLIDVKNRTA